MEHRVTRIGVMSLAKIQAAILLVFGLILGVTSFLGALPRGASDIGLLALILFPISYAVGGFMIGIITAGLYNWLARRIGGVEIELSSGSTRHQEAAESR